MYFCSIATQICVSQGHLSVSSGLLRSLPNTRDEPAQIKGRMGAGSQAFAKGIKFFPRLLETVLGQLFELLKADSKPLRSPGWAPGLGQAQEGGGGTAAVSHVRAAGLASPGQAAGPRRGSGEPTPPQPGFAKPRLQLGAPLWRRPVPAGGAAGAQQPVPFSKRQRRGPPEERPGDQPGFLGRSGRPHPRGRPGARLARSRSRSRSPPPALPAGHPRPGPAQPPRGLAAAGQHRRGRDRPPPRSAPHSPHARRRRHRRHFRRHHPAGGSDATTQLPASAPPGAAPAQCGRRAGGASRGRRGRGTRKNESGQQW